MSGRRISVCVLSGFLLLQAIGHAQRGSEEKPVRALPPDYSDDVKRAFVADAREKLQGERPSFANVRIVQPGQKPPAGPSGGGETSSGNEGGVFAWSNIISREALEDEVKAQKLQIDQTVTTPTEFKGGANKKARRQFTTLAVMFAIIGEYDGDVRWQEEAPPVRDLFAQAGFSCKVGTDASYNQAKLRKEDLENLVRGSKLQGLKEAEAKAQWDQVADRPPLMNRMEEAFNKRLRPMLSSEGDFKKNTEEIFQQAQVLAALGEVIQREGFEYWDDEGYSDEAKRLRDAALEIVEAVKLNSYAKANEAAGEISKACSVCHEGYRG